MVERPRRRSAPGRGGQGRSQKERIYAALRRDILTLALKPGQVLVEAALARRFAVSKTPVREALALLQQDGLLEAMPRRGYLVTAVTLSDVHELFELRAVLEGAAAELAAARITPEELMWLENLLSAPQAAVPRKRIGKLLDTNRLFHLAIARASGNGRLEYLVERTLDEMTRLIAIGYATGEHADIVAALKTRDGERARAAMVRHVLLTRERVLRREAAVVRKERQGQDFRERPSRPVHGRRRPSADRRS